ncbi:GNAT family N-acetyltransferase [Lutibacter sp. HS1-25]|uniref:GNAT family N-acetyltransferase n=1 Tax=Lutibacter sp. HS1-25 TaxID=2485000 RepID=UPI0010115E3F|nr:GNAT family N-acetyltransferase [Lutibacter sp. HS1-25]RXP57102.1 GNAT family N-acetyltransferase [Lutibacter sp. HS1-25]
MEIIEIKLIPTKNILTIIPLLKQLNNYTSESILKKRVLEMSKQHYKCVGMYINEELIGIAGLWFLTRHYCGSTIEPDHVIINSAFRNKGYGKKLFNWIHNYAQNIGYEAAELNTYIENISSHRFYENEGYKKLGFHYLKIF